MLSRRSFGGFATCALCSLTGFLASDASAQTAAPAATPGVARKILSRIDGPTAGYETLVVEVEIEPGVTVGRHTHPGIESGYVLEGGLELPMEGAPTRMLKTGDVFQVPAGVAHAGGKNGPAKTRVLSNYILEKGKPLASPA